MAFCGCVCVVMVSLYEGSNRRSEFGVWDPRIRTVKAFVGVRTLEIECTTTMIHCFLSLFLAVSAYGAVFAQAPIDNYVAAVADALVRTLDEVSNSLIVIDAKSPVRVVTWVRSDQVNRLKDPGTGAWLRKAPSDMWVTVVPKLREFCRAFAASRAASIGELTLRLEQRLGLPPGNNKTAFVELEVKDAAKTKNLFRPCASPSVVTGTCGVEPPAESVPAGYRNWFYRQYYFSFGVAPTYPWTALGYTFDWAPAEGGEPRFVEVGESEFVIPRGGDIQIQSVTPTLEYCSAPQ